MSSDTTPLVPSNTTLAHPAAVQRFGGPSSEQGGALLHKGSTVAPTASRVARAAPEGWGGGGDLPPRPRLKRFHRHRPAAGRENGLHIPMRFHAPVLTGLIDQYVVEAS